MDKGKNRSVKTILLSRPNRACSFSFQNRAMQYMANTEASGGQSAFLSIRNICKEFSGVRAVNDVDLDIQQGEFFCLLGGSGSGKSTLLRMIAGLEKPSSGTIRIDGQDITETPAWSRPVNMMFQSYALFPHMSVEKNIGYGLRQDKWEKAQAEAEAQAEAKRLAAEPAAEPAVEEEAEAKEEGLATLASVPRERRRGGVAVVMFFFSIQDTLTRQHRQA